jgi:membrane protein DedA with SNARE-associated domain
MEAISDAVLDLVRAHALLAPVIAFLLAFGESLAFVSLLLPATVLLVGGGGVFSAAGLGFWPVWSATVLGAVLGDWLSFWIGFHYRDSIGGVWPLSRHPTLLPKGRAFFDRWGAPGVFLGRFFGPLRCVMPLVAGTCAMRQIPFQSANIASAVLWATAVLAPGRLATGWFP